MNDWQVTPDVPSAGSLVGTVLPLVPGTVAFDLSSNAQALMASSSSLFQFRMKAFDSTGAAFTNTNDLYDEGVAGWGERGT